MLLIMKFDQPDELDLVAINALLSSHDLPTQGVEHILCHFLVIHDERGNVIACAGFERFADTGLLRSVAVDDEYRGCGFGVEIVGAVISKARSEGVKEFVLLTTTAKDLFADKFGFDVTSRESIGATFDSSSEWNLPRCSSAVVMTKDLTTAE